MQSSRDQFDKENVFDVIKNIPTQFTRSFRDTLTTFTQKPEKIVFCGMGGSASPANLLKNYLSAAKINFNIPLKIVRSYSLPQNVDSSWSGFFDSYSGNTEETLSALTEARERKLREMIIIAHGGKLKEVAKKENLSLINIPDFSQPRMSYIYVMGALLKMFQCSGLIKLDEAAIEQDVEKLMATDEMEKIGQRLAGLLQGSIPIIYSSINWEALAMVWKININENAKLPSFWNIFPEMNHNEINGFAGAIGNFKTIIIKDMEDDPRINKRIDVFTQILKERLKIEIMEMPSGSALYKMLYTLMVGLWVSYYLALLNKVDPTPVAMVEEFKRRLVT